MMNALCQRRSNTGNGFQFRNRGVLDAFPSAKVAQERLEFFRTEPFHRFKRVREPSAATSLAVEGVDEAMGFVPGMDQHATRAVEHQRLHASSEDGFFPLGEGCERKSVGPPVLFQGLFDRAEMCFSTIDEEQVRPLFLSLSPANNDFFHHAKVVKGLAFDDVFAVFFLGGAAINKAQIGDHEFADLAGFASPALRHGESIEDMANIDELSR